MQLEPDSVAPAGQANVVLGLTRQTELPVPVKDTPSTIQPPALDLLQAEMPPEPTSSKKHVPLIKLKKAGQELLADAGAVTL